MSREAVLPRKGGAEGMVPAARARAEPQWRGYEW